MKIVYLPLCADPLHYGHIRLIKRAQTYGNVILGLMSDKAITSYKNIPQISFNYRQEVLAELKGIYKIVAEEADFSTYLQLKPDIIIHGNDWASVNHRLYNTCLKLIKIMQKWNGQLIEPKTTKGVSSTWIKNSV